MKYICDKKRHLICIPYSIENLHVMAEKLDIKRCWFHKNHYDIPKKRMAEIQARCTVVETRFIVDVIRSPLFGWAEFADDVRISTTKPTNQVLPEHEEYKFNGFSD